MEDGSGAVPNEEHASAATEREASTAPQLLWIYASALGAALAKNARAEKAEAAARDATAAADAAKAAAS